MKKPLKHLPPLRRPSGFTLIELLVVIAVIAILAALLYPLVGSAMNIGKDSTCKQNLSSIGKAFVALAYDHEGVMPGNVSGQPANAQAWQKAWLGDEVLAPGDSFPTWWVPGAVQSSKKGTIYDYITVSSSNAGKVYLCPATKKTNYNDGLGSNGRFDYSALHVFSGAHYDAIPLTAEVVTSPFGSSILRTINTPILIEEDAYWWINRTHIEPGAGNADRMGLNHNGRTNFFAADGSVQQVEFDFLDNRGVRVGPDMNMLRTKGPRSGNWVYLTGGAYGSWSAK